MTYDERVTSALEKAPSVLVSDGFAARVMLALPARPVVLPAHRTHFGRTAMFGCALLLCVLLVASLQSARHGSVVGALVEWISLAQLAGIALWLSLRSRELRS
jgi:hypothetical protein